MLIDRSVDVVCRDGVQLALVTTEALPQRALNRWGVTAGTSDGTAVSHCVHERDGADFARWRWRHESRSLSRTLFHTRISSAPTCKTSTTLKLSSRPLGRKTSVTAGERTSSGERGSQASAAGDQASRICSTVSCVENRTGSVAGPPISVSYSSSARLASRSSSIRLVLSAPATTSAGWTGLQSDS